MKSELYKVLLLTIMGLFLASCGDDDDNVDEYEEWRILNENVIKDIAASGEYNQINASGNAGAVYYKVLEEGSGTKQIYWGSVITIYYEGYLVDENNTLYESVTRENSEKPEPFTVIWRANKQIGDVIRGWSILLPYMVEGDKWEVYVPYQLAYGSGGSTNIPPYSTLRFIIEVKEIVEQ